MATGRRTRLRSVAWGWGWVLACVLLGVLMTLGLAWGPEVLRIIVPPRKVRTINELIVLEATGPDGRTYRAMCHQDGIRGETWDLTPIELTAALEPWMETGPHPKGVPPRWVPRPELVRPDVHPAFESSSSSASAWGWPMRCLCYSHTTREGRDFFDIFPHGQRHWVWNGYRYDLPGDVIWRGMIGDVALFAGALWGLLRGPFAARQWRRRRRGWCGGCGYDRKGLAADVSCPECGADPAGRYTAPMRRFRTSAGVSWGARWACTLLSVVIVAAWVLSRQWGVMWFIDFDPQGRPDTGWLPSWRIGPGWVEIGIPWYMPLALALLPAAYLWNREIRGRRRKRAGLCPGCGYNRAGLATPATPCPECGASPRG